MRKIKQGNGELRRDFIIDYESYIVKCVSKAMNSKFVDKRNNDEFSIGLSAFNEAIDCFDEDKGKDFFTFSQLVITRRIINYNIKRNRENKLIQKTKEDYLHNENYLKLDNKGFVFNTDEYYELIDFKKKLREFGIDVMELADKVPQHKDTKRFCVDIAKFISGNDESYRKFMKKKSLPIMDILKLKKCSRRTIERNRKYIISIIIVLRSDLEIIKSFVYNLEKEVQF